MTNPANNMYCLVSFKGPDIQPEILEVQGVDKLAKYLVKEVQDVYRLQGVPINDKHIEIIIRQMMRTVAIEEPGATNLLPNDLINKSELLDINQKIMSEELKPAKYKPVIMGITKASISKTSSNDCEYI